MPRKTKEQIEKLEETIKKVVPFGRKSKTKTIEDKKEVENSIKEEINSIKSKSKKIEEKTAQTKNKKTASKSTKSENKKEKSEKATSNKKTAESRSLKLSKDDINELKETVKAIEEIPAIKRTEESIKKLDKEIAKDIETDIKQTAKKLENGTKKTSKQIEKEAKKAAKQIEKEAKNAAKEIAKAKKSKGIKNKANKKSSKIQVSSNKKTLTLSNMTASNKFTSKEMSNILAKKFPNNTKKKNTQKFMTEYYDLPPKYNKTVVKLLAQTPKTLFIYWEISDEDVKKYKEEFGENFFETTKPVLIIHNDTLNYSFEVEINDFANSWYLHVNDSRSNYRIELGRRPIRKEGKFNTDYIYITSSNEIESPNDHILFDELQKMVYFKNVKTNQISGKSIANLTFIRNMGKIYDIYDLYQKMYAELYKDEGGIEKISNPSSHTSSQFK